VPTTATRIPKSGLRVTVARTRPASFHTARLKLLVNASSARDGYATRPRLRSGCGRPGESARLKSARPGNPRYLRTVRGGGLSFERPKVRGRGLFAVLHRPSERSASAPARPQGQVPATRPRSARPPASPPAAAGSARRTVFGWQRTFGQLETHVLNAIGGRHRRPTGPRPRQMGQSGMVELTHARPSAGTPLHRDRSHPELLTL